MGITRIARIEQYASAVQADIVNCVNEQPFDDGEAVWTFGFHTDVADLLMSHDVPEEMHEEVAARLSCPECGSPLCVCDDVGTKFDFEESHESTVNKAMRKHGRKLFEFESYLQRLPLLGATHPMGKRILREIRKGKPIVLEKREWFRARQDKTYGFGPTPREFVSDQRYNSSGQPHWYFGSTAETAMAEIRKQAGWIQRFGVGPLAGILDLRAWSAEDDRAFNAEGDYDPPHNLVITSLIFSDLLTRIEDAFSGEPVTGERRWKPEYLLTRYVAEAAEAAGFVGILYRSVRDPWGENLVVFDPDWHPTVIGEPQQIALPDGAEKNFHVFDGGEAMIFANYSLLDNPGESGTPFEGSQKCP
ncbi:MAG TPA: RES family NAD+ phosphorylase [Verrucomicrobiae bacterium]|jgi:hypothetical protein|nr:RES family NAD+ phosphorylase [Verrucomicrobiae bacterium]